MEAHLRLRVLMRHSWWRWLEEVLLPLKMRLLIALLSAITLLVPCYADDNPGRKLRVVVFGGHPDDPESGAGGLIATLTRQGHEAICAYGTTFRADRRFFGRPEGEVRKEEATAACKVLGAKPNFFPYAHEKLVADEATLKAVSAWLAKVKPDIVVTHWPLDTHPNHHVSVPWSGGAISDGGLEPLLFEVMTDQQTIGFSPDVFFDIAPVRDVKKKSLDEHKSQGPQEIWQVHERMHRRRGAQCGVEYAFDEILRRAVHSTFVPEVYENEAVWRAAVGRSDVRLQFDPDHNPSGAPVERRAIQLGLRGETLAKYAREWLLGIEDVSEFVRVQSRHARSPFDRLLTPREDVYPVNDPEVAARLGVAAWEP